MGKADTVVVHLEDLVAMAVAVEDLLEVSVDVDVDADADAAVVVDVAVDVDVAVAVAVLLMKENGFLLQSLDAL